MKAGLFGGGWEDYLDALNDAFDRHVAENAPPHPFGASVDAIMTGYPDIGEPMQQGFGYGSREFTLGMGNGSLLGTPNYYPVGDGCDDRQGVLPGPIVAFTGTEPPVGLTMRGGQQDAAGNGDDVRIAQANDNLPPRWDMFPRDPACIEASHECLSEAPPGRRSECLVAEVGCNAQVAKAKMYDPKDSGTGFFPNGRWVIMPGGPTGVPRLYRKTTPSWDSHEE